MPPKVIVPEGRKALAEYLLFADEVYRCRQARWPAMLDLDLPLLLGDSPFGTGRTLRPFLALDGARPVARATAVVDERYNRHWNERLGHLILFEALPGTRDAVRLLVEEASAWLRSRGMLAVRAGFGMLDGPFVIDEYELLPPEVVRQNPPYYHSLLKDAGFETERGFVDYKIEVRSDLVARWRGALEAARRGGFEIVPLRDVPESRRVPEFTALWAETFRDHWGWSAFSETEIELLFAGFSAVGMHEASVIAYRGDEPVGMVAAVPEVSDLAVTAPGRSLSDAEKLNFLAIGVRKEVRGRGVAFAMASYAYLELVRRGATHLSYTMVLDDNWPSRRTAERLGAHVCASYVAYRRELAQAPGMPAAPGRNR